MNYELEKKFTFMITIEDIRPKISQNSNICSPKSYQPQQQSHHHKTTSQSNHSHILTKASGLNIIVHFHLIQRVIYNVAEGNDHTTFETLAV